MLLCCPLRQYCPGVDMVELHGILISAYILRTEPAKWWLMPELLPDEGKSSRAAGHQRACVGALTTLW